MTVTLTNRSDINLDTFLAVAWKMISETTLDRIAHCRAAGRRRPYPWTRASALGELLHKKSFHPLRPLGNVLISLKALKYFQSLETRFAY
jgi:hypothetical protein